MSSHGNAASPRRLLRFHRRHFRHRRRHVPVQAKLVACYYILRQSLANMRNVENDLKQISMAMMFAIMGLVTNYFGPARPGTRS
ncbi:hypothetical protein SLA2020_443950 [Shorea laevis]